MESRIEVLSDLAESLDEAEFRIGDPDDLMESLVNRIDEAERRTEVIKEHYY